jgi:N-alpha-acetyltransferase 35, NatC auxiliary subunit
MRESLGVSFHSISRAISERWPTNTEPPPLRDLERGFLRLLTAHIKSLSYTPPRARRAAMQFAQGWAEMYATLARVVRTLDERPTSVDPAVLRALPCVAVQHALAAARDIILSGFALELYAPMERAQAYYFAACALGERVKVLAELQGVPRREGSVESEEAGLQLEFDATLRCLCLGFFGVCIYIYIYSQKKILKQRSRSSRY